MPLNELRCGWCRSALDTGDAFCGHCGMRAGIKFWDHADRRNRGQMTSGTRYLCVAAYLNPRFASTVIREVLASRRAVVPSYDIDLVPIIEHCLQARKIHLARDVALTIILPAGLVDHY
jgi:hypothetical protein